jgi:hypothetical protein
MGNGKQDGQGTARRVNRRGRIMAHEQQAAA